MSSEVATTNTVMSCRINYNSPPPGKDGIVLKDRQESLLLSRTIPALARAENPGKHPAQDQPTEKRSTERGMRREPPSQERRRGTKQRPKRKSEQRACMCREHIIRINNPQKVATIADKGGYLEFVSLFNTHHINTCRGSTHRSSLIGNSGPHVGNLAFDLAHGPVQFTGNRQFLVIVKEEIRLAEVAIDGAF